MDPILALVLIVAALAGGFVAGQLRRKTVFLAAIGLSDYRRTRFMRLSRSDGSRSMSRLSHGARMGFPTLTIRRRMPRWSSVC